MALPEAVTLVRNRTFERPSGVGIDDSLERLSRRGPSASPMAEASHATAIVAVSIVGAVAQVMVTFLRYEPPARDDGHDPIPLLEASIFGLVFGVLFVVVGIVLSAVASFAPPYSELGLLVFTPIGFYIAYAAATDRIDTYRDRATVLLWGVVGFVVGAFPLALVLASYA